MVLYSVNTAYSHVCLRRDPGVWRGMVLAGVVLVPGLSSCASGTEHTVKEKKNLPTCLEHISSAYKGDMDSV